ncbi:hypothetical protein PAHAL_4G229000 [Panicum hallii]|uniref:Uncharacterized protein n=1 Tax=Panicum hallii TaxID=206008 RepID=A0A2S3HJM3_9POAL|nr:hypothetical protein PAHAL_4G229000 [Panicum hallii]
MVRRSPPPLLRSDTRPLAIRHQFTDGLARSSRLPVGRCLRWAMPPSPESPPHTKPTPTRSRTPPAFPSGASAAPTCSPSICGAVILPGGRGRRPRLLGLDLRRRRPPRWFVDASGLPDGCERRPACAPSICGTIDLPLARQLRAGPHEAQPPPHRLHTGLLHPRVLEPPPPPRPPVCQHCISLCPDWISTLKKPDACR